MSYITEYTLTVRDPESGCPCEIKFLQVLDDAAKFYGISDWSIYKEEYRARLDQAHQTVKAAAISPELEKALRSTLDDFFESRWYDHNTDMMRISAAFPDLLFELHCEGERRDDIKLIWYYRGRLQEKEAQIVLPTLDWVALGLEPPPAVEDIAGTYEESICTTK